MKPTRLHRKRFLPLLMLTTVAAAASPARATGPRVLVGPNILISHDGDLPHCETMIAANPRDPKNLVGASTTFARPPEGTFMNKTYASHDGGYTWKDASLPIEIEKGGGDPQVAFASDGTAFFVGIGEYGMAVHRSEDGGDTWQKPTLVRFSDHENIAIDQTTGRFAGRIYLAGEIAKTPSTEGRNSQVAIWRSEDGGRTFIGPIEVAEHQGGGLAAYTLAVLSDGTLVVPMIKYPNPAIDKTTTLFTALCAVSTDGGLTFGAPQKMGDVYFGGYGEFRRKKRAGRIDNMSGIVFAAGRGATRDRLYAGWPDFRDGMVPRIFVTHSSDRGQTWSKPIPVDAPGPAGSSQYQPMMAVNDEGTVGVFWFDTRSFAQRDHYNLYFAASIDGAETFLPSVRVSSAPSFPTGPGNVRPVSLSWGAAAAGQMNFFSAFSTWPNGGDYMGATADSTGTFHPFWTDSRTGTFQLYTAPVRVLREAPKPSEGAASRREESVTARLALSYDPVRTDPATGELLVPVRLKNISTENVFGPLRVEVRETVPAEMLNSDFVDAKSAATIVNASNGKTGIGAVFDYAAALGDFEALEPGALSDAVVWRVRTSDPGHSDLHFRVEITGRIDPKKESK